MTNPNSPTDASPPEPQHSITFSVQYSLYFNDKTHVTAMTPLSVTWRCNHNSTGQFNEETAGRIAYWELSNKLGQRYQPPVEHLEGIKNAVDSACTEWETTP